MFQNRVREYISIVFQNWAALQYAKNVLLLTTLSDIFEVKLCIRQYISIVFHNRATLQYAKKCPFLTTLSDIFEVELRIRQINIRI